MKDSKSSDAQARKGNARESGRGEAVECRSIMGRGETEDGAPSKTKLYIQPLENCRLAATLVIGRQLLFSVI